MHRNPAYPDPVAFLDRATDEQLVLPCRVYRADLWFADTAAEMEQAKQLCAPCPVRDDCLAAALLRREPWGVWGGEIVEGGVVVARRRTRGRPRKVQPVAPAA
jgi:WhiB family transcriptional regulator, redox-sensing transcriptional regulator